MDVELGGASENGHPLGSVRFVLNPELPPDNVRRIEVRITDEERPDMDGGDGFDDFKPIDVGSTSVPGITSIIRDAILKKGASVIRHEQERAFRSVGPPLRTQDHDV